MKILALDSSGLVASVAIAEDDRILAEYTVNYKKTHSQTLLPMLAEIGKMVELNMEEIDAIAVAAGPGSFTGLRIGSATAKGLGLALGKPLISVPTVDGLAANLFGTEGIICPMMDARRNQVYTGAYSYEDGELLVLKDQLACDVREMAAWLNDQGRRVILLGDGLPVYKNILKDELRVEWMEAPMHLQRQRAGALASLAFRYWREGRYETAGDHRPDYLRLSQAERERMEKEAAGKRSARHAGERNDS